MTTARRTAFNYWDTISAPTALGPGGVPLPDPKPTGTFLQDLPASPGRRLSLAGPCENTLPVFSQVNRLQLRAWEKVVPESCEQDKMPQVRFSLARSNTTSGYAFRCTGWV